MFNILADVVNFCKDTSPIWQFIGIVLYVFKVAIPILLIVFGMMDLGKAVVANDDKAIKNATSSLVKRAIAGVVIFFLPYLVSAIFGLVIGFDEVETTYDACISCVTNPGNEPCEGYVRGVTGKETYTKKGDDCVNSKGTKVADKFCE